MRERAVEIKKVLPILRIFDEAATREFYIDFMGFTVDWEHRFEDGLPLYMQVSLGDLSLHLSGHHGDCTPGARIYIEVDEVATLHEELIAKEYKHARPGLCPTEWGTVEMTIADPNGNRLTFSQRMPETS